LEKLYRNVRAGIDHDLQLLQEGKVELSKELQKMNIFVLSTSSPGLDAFLTRCVPTLMIAPWCRPLPWALERAEALKYCNETIAWSHLPDHELLPRWRNWPEPVTRCPPFTACICLDANQKYYNEKVDHQSRMYLARLFLNEKAANRVCAAALASERYRLIYGRWPISWEQLIPQFLPEALNDPYTGKPLKLKLVEDGLIVYSVGFNEKDDGGAVLPGDDRKVLDLGVRLWNPDQRRRPARKLDDQ